MIHVVDNFLPEALFKDLQTYCKETSFEEKDAGGKKFSVLPVPKEVIPFFELNEFDIILGFIRRAYKGFDNQWRIHGDGIIQGEKPRFASVFYINDPEGVTPSGTAFYKHEKHGYEMPRDISNEEFDRMLREDANDLYKWEETDRITARPNRQLIYGANQFHSKYPNEIEQGERIVLVNFYKPKIK